MGDDETCEHLGVRVPAVQDVTNHFNNIECVKEETDDTQKITPGMFSYYFCVTALVMPLVFLLGISWHSLHPQVSVFTGRASPRGWYIDENSLDPGHFDMNKDRYPLLSDDKHPSIHKKSLCHALRWDRLRRVGCHQHISKKGTLVDNFDIARVLPISGAVSPISESIVLVVPWWMNEGTDKSQLQFRSSILHLLRRLSESPWLAKTILVVSPSHKSTNLKETVDSFFSVYFGSNHPTIGRRLFSPNGESLPFAFHSSMVRSLLVVDCTLQPPQDQSNNLRSEVRILPMGSRGSLPNMDLTFASMLVYSRARFIQSSSRYSGRDSTIVMHQYQHWVREWSKRLQDLQLSHHIQNLLFPLLDLLAFEFSMAIGPYPPHSTALDMGVDALTIQAVLFDPPTRNGSRLVVDTIECIAEYVEKLEYLVRALSNLHERLHHSTSLYMLPSPYKFVKHEEYLVPNLLLVVPCLIRLLLLVFVLIEQVNLEVMVTFVAITVVGTFGFSGYVEGVTYAMHSVSLWQLIVGYATMILTVLTMLNSRTKRVTLNEWSDIKHSMHFCACMLSVILHVSLAFGHVSLSVPSSIVWTTLIAFPRFGNRLSQTQPRQQLKDLKILQRSTSILVRHLKTLLKVGVITVTSPFPFVSPWIFPSVSPYILYGYIPLHIMFSLLVLL